MFASNESSFPLEDYSLQWVRRSSITSPALISTVRIVLQSEYYEDCHKLLLKRAKDFTSHVAHDTGRSPEDRNCAVMSAHWIKQSLEGTHTLAELHNPSWWSDGLKAYMAMTATCPYVPSAEAVEQDGPEICWICYEAHEHAIASLQEVQTVLFASYLKRRRQLPSKRISYLYHYDAAPWKWCEQ